MKLRRLISALIVFTLVLTCAMSAVSAATYRTTTSYTTDGKVRVEASVAGAAEGDMVSYIIYGDENATLGDGDATPKTSVTEDNIVYIDQKTADAEGNISFSIVDLDEADVENRLVKITTNNADPLTAWTGEKVATSVEQIADTTYKTYFTFYGGTGYGTNIDSMTVTEYDAEGNVIGEANTLKAGDGVWVYTNSTLVIDAVPSADYVISEAKILKSSGTAYAGKDVEGAGAVDVKDVMVGNRYKDYLGDGINGTLSGDANGIVESGTSNQIRMNAATEQTGGAAFMSVDAKPLFSTIDGNKAVTFLMTKSANITGTYGIHIYVYDNEAAEGAEPVQVYTGLAAYDTDSSNNFAIQLVAEENGEGSEYFDETKYDFKAVPYILSGDEEVEFTTTGTNNYYTVDSTTVATETAN